MPIRYFMTAFNLPLFSAQPIKCLQRCISQLPKIFHKQKHPDMFNDKNNRNNYGDVFGIGMGLVVFVLT